VIYKEIEMTWCPECEAVAEIERRYVLRSTDGPVTMVAVRCLQGHYFNMPEEDLSA
jgi:hypothetical protein